MCFSRILNTKRSLYILALIIVPTYAWTSFFTYWNKKIAEYANKQHVYKTHRCVITYRASKGLFGWPTNVTQSIKPNIKSETLLSNLYEPFESFLRTAQSSLDIAVMIINVNTIYIEIIKARRRGVKIRVIFNFEHSQNCKDQIRALLIEGVQCQFFVSTSTQMESMMHQKYMIKDAHDSNNSYICVGSLNFTTTSVLSNYESIIFMSDHKVVQAFQNNFNDCWDTITMDNNGLINKTILCDAQF
ncbi:hypothetical protein ABEB36_001860 [Hypothenemus hampei]|uniref:Mitochondrial cardiolipin hydrolase n=1 Tax=Hypothenemus hampei TaxID=57062 RepID=A0ABD1FIK6_HYPHA